MILKIKVINVWNSLALHSFAIILVPLLSRLLMSCWPHGGNTIQQCGPPQISATLGTVTRVQSLKSALMGKCTPGSSANATNQGLVSLTVDWQVSERDFERKVDFVLHIFFFLHISLFPAMLDLRCWACSFLTCGEQSYSTVREHALLTVAASLVGERGRFHGALASVVMMLGLGCSAACGTFQPSDRTPITCTGRGDCVPLSHPRSLRQVDSKDSVDTLVEAW